jgi:hypothetical protein
VIENGHHALALPYPTLPSPPLQGPPPEQDIPLAVPKKTKLYVEQTQREREMASEIHRRFQRDLCKLRLTTARAYVKTLTDGFMVSRQRDREIEIER